MRRITVFCGSSSGTDEIYEMEAGKLGKILAESNIELVYGGADVGLMGAVANGVLSHNGKVIGVLPRFLEEKEIAHKGLTELHLVETMHERKTKMHELCDGVIALPGGLGTLEEFFEMLTWGQLGLHEKPMGVLNINGYYDELIRLLNSMVDKGFLKATDRDMVLISDDGHDLIEKMTDYKSPRIEKWISKETV